MIGQIYKRKVWILCNLMYNYNCQELINYCDKLDILLNFIDKISNNLERKHSHIFSLLYPNIGMYEDNRL